MAGIDLKEPTDISEISSSIWGGGAKPVTQQHGIPGFRPDWYGYSSGLGWPSGYHVGLDISMPRGTPLKSNVFGKVVQAGWSDSYRPNPVTIVTEDDPATRDINEAGSKIIYGHLWEDAVKVGQTVRPGDLIGYSGEQTVLGTMQPDGSGAHLHYETRMRSNETTTGEYAVNPIPFLASRLPAGDALNNSGDIIVDVPDVGNGGGGGGSSSGGKELCIRIPFAKDACFGVPDFGNIGARIGVFMIGLLVLSIGVARVIGIGGSDFVPAARAVRLAKRLTK